MKRRTFTACAAGSAAGLVLEHAWAAPRGSASPGRLRGVRDATVLYWNAVLGDAIAATRTAPTVAARAISMAYEAAYNAWASWDGKAAFSLPSMTKQRAASDDGFAKSVAVSHAVHAVLVDLFPSQFEVIDAALATLVVDAQGRGHDWVGAAHVGRQAAAALLAARHGDGSNQRILGRRPRHLDAAGLMDRDRARGIPARPPYPPRRREDVLRARAGADRLEYCGPEFVSGHSTFSAAAAAVPSALFGGRLPRGEQ